MRAQVHTCAIFILFVEPNILAPEGVIQPLLGIALTENNQLPEVSDQLSEMYGDCLNQAEKLPITVLGTELEPLAEKCYQTLVACLHAESRKTH